jgi:hypothetical protein
MRYTRTMRALVAIVLSAALTSASIADDMSVPTRYGALAKSLPRDGRARTDALLAFVESDRPALAERVKAALALSSTKGISLDEKIAFALLRARLYGVGDDVKKRTRALEEARKLALPVKKKQASDIEELSLADMALARVKTALAKKKPVDDDDKKRIRTASTVAKSLGDEPRSALLHYTALLVDEASSKLKFPETNKLLRAGGEHRDTATVRVGVRRLRARHLSKAGKWQDAAHESLVADRAVTAPPKRAAPVTTSDSPYRRSKETAELCKQARAHQVNCAHLEEERMGARTFYDFSRERAARFSSAANDAVMAEYEDVLKRCVHVSTELTALDTEIEMEWTVTPKGVVDDFDILKPRFLQTGPFQECARDAFAQFRYPRFRGPNATVRFELSI